jgi:hypothetical protein
MLDLDSTFFPLAPFPGKSLPPEQAIETAAMMLTDKSRGYCLEMICADFLAGANLDNGNPEVLLHPSQGSSSSCQANRGRRLQRYFLDLC